MNLTASEREALTTHHTDVDRRARWLEIVEALQAHNYLRFLSTLFRSRLLAPYLMGRLLEEVPLQVRKRFDYRRGR